MVSINHRIISQNLVLRDPTKDDLPSIFEATQTDGFNDGMRWDAPSSIEELIPFHQAILERWEKGEAYSFSIDTLEDNTFIGRISINQLSDQQWEIGFMVFPKFQNKGFVTEATMAIINFGFNHLKIPNIKISHADWNLASKRVIEKCGFTYKGVNIGGIKRKGVPVDEILYEMTNPQL